MHGRRLAHRFERVGLLGLVYPPSRLGDVEGRTPRLTKIDMVPTSLLREWLEQSARVVWMAEFTDDELEELEAAVEAVNDARGEDEEDDED